MIAHDAPAYAETVVQDGFVRYADGEFYDVCECHVERARMMRIALESHLDLFPRDLGDRTVQARTHLSIAEQEPGVRVASMPYAALPEWVQIRSLSVWAVNTVAFPPRQGDRD